MNLFTLDGVTKSYGDVVALHPTSLLVTQGRSLGVIGESGSGKTTLARLMLGLSRTDAGQVSYRGEPVVAGRRGPSRLRRETSLVLQDPYGSLNPRMTIGQIIGEPLTLLGVGGARRERVRQVLEQVELDPAWASRHPHELSGGQRQRVAIARALASRPEVIVADEPVSALDVSVRARIIELLERLAVQEQVTLVVISHDLGIVQRLCQEMVVLVAGRVVESGTTEAILADPQHPATVELLDALPVLPPA